MIFLDRSPKKCETLNIFPNLFFLESILEYVDCRFHKSCKILTKSGKDRSQWKKIVTFFFLKRFFLKLFLWTFNAK